MEETKWKFYNLKKKKKKKNLALNVLSKIALVGCFMVAGSNQYFWRSFYREFLRDLKRRNNRKERKRLYDALRYLRQKKFVDIKETKKGVKITIMTAGYKVIKEIEKWEELKIKKPPEWDRKLRFVIFDIPRTKQSARNAFINVLKEWKFFMVQKSVWVFPYDCMNEIAVLRKLLEIEPYVKVLVTDAIEGEYKILKHFKLI